MSTEPRQDPIDETPADPAAGQGESPAPREVASPPRTGGLRALAEFLAVLGIGIIFARAFVAEAYIVPTGSMAPTLLGSHRDLLCPNCGYSFAIGLDESGQSGRAVCPNCGDDRLEGVPSSDGAGDRLLVQKYLFDLRPPGRWEVAVFQNPEDAREAFVKRVVGLPGESVEIREGDVWIDGQRARKSLEAQRAIRIPVYDHDFRPRDSDRFPRWIVRRDLRDAPSTWEAIGTAFRHRSIDVPGVDWLEYRHWRPDRQVPGSVEDFVAYNGADPGGINRVDDLMLDARVFAGPDCHAVCVRLGSRTDRVTVRLPVGGGGPDVRVDGRKIEVVPTNIGLEASESSTPRWARLEASVFDRQLTVALDGRLMFEPIAMPEPSPLAPPNRTAGVSIGVEGGTAEIRGLKVYRDVYYTSSLSSALRRPFGVGEPYRLGEGEYFVLGDNSPVSNDSRFWSNSPVVSADKFLGKPFLVHLPSQAVPLKVFGGEIYWIPDPREIRYIR